MRWNAKPKSKELAPTETKVALGAPVAYNRAYMDASRGYSDNWDIEEAYRKGVAQVTWVWRCIDAISSNQAKLPIYGRHGNSPRGRITTNHESLDLLNAASNMGENAFVFRYRISAQLLISSRGVFIEMIKSRGGKVVALQLLPPQYTAPIPSPTRFVDGYEVDMPNGYKEILSPDRVIWIRRPHPLDPYLSMTPMEAAGVAIEIELLSKAYNRNFLLNDGRPGSLLVVRSEISDEDRRELEYRFRGNVNQAGRTTVVASEDGIELLDMSANPRDAAYIEMRGITKNEILTAFGVPESILGNASGTFANSIQEATAFWTETMDPHLELIARGLDKYEPDLWFEFDKSKVPALIVAEREEMRAEMERVQAGLTTRNEWREKFGRKKVKSVLMDSTITQANWAIMGSTSREFTDAQLGIPPEEGFGGEVPPITEEGVAPPTEEGQAPSNQEGVPGAAPTGAVTLDQNSERFVVDGEEITGEDFGFKSYKVGEIDPDARHWAKMLEGTLMAWASSVEKDTVTRAESVKLWPLVDGHQLFDEAKARQTLRESVYPILVAIVGGSTSKAEVEVQPQYERIERIVTELDNEIRSSLMTEEEDGKILFLMALAILMDRIRKKLSVWAETETIAALNAVNYHSGSTVTWVSRNDDRVRPAHRILNGQTVAAGTPFKTMGHSLRFPGDPLAPLALTVHCRCRLRSSK